MNRILIIDDSPAFRLQASAVLAADGFDVVGESVDGASGLRDARRLRPDLVLLDIGLPDLDGFEVCRRIRAESWGRRVLIVALTGWGEDRDRARAHEVGFDAHLVKPLEHDTLLAILAAPSATAEPVQPGIDSTR